MVVVFDNRGYRGMRGSHLAYYPDGAAARHKLFYGETIDSCDYHELATAFGAVGIRVEHPSKLKSALADGYEAVKRGKMAIINVGLEA